MQRYEFNDGKSSKFWQIEQIGAELHISWGKIGTSGQSQVKDFESAALADVARLKLIAEKTKKGYSPSPSNAELGAAMDSSLVSTNQAHEPQLGQLLGDVASAVGLRSGSGDEACDVREDGAALAMRLAQIRAEPGFDQRLLQAWRAVLNALAQGDATLLLPKVGTVAQIKKHLKADEVLARQLAVWLQDLWQSVHRADRNAAHLALVAQALLDDPQLIRVEAQAAAAHAAQWQPLPGTAPRDDGRFDHPPAQPAREPVLWPTEAEAQHLLSSWRERISGTQAKASLKAELKALVAALKAGEPLTPDMEVFWLCISQQHEPIAPLLIRRHGLLVYLQRLLQAARRPIVREWHWQDNTYAQRLNESVALLADRGNDWGTDSCRAARELIRQADGATRAACEQLLVGGLSDVPQERLPFLAGLMPDSQSLATAVWGAAPPNLGDKAVAEPEGRPGTLERALRDAGTTQKMQAIELMQARWPLAMLIAATRVAVSQDRQAPAAQGLVRGLLDQLGAARLLARPWLTPAAWRWLQAQTEPQAQVAQASTADLPQVLVNPPWLRKSVKTQAREVLELPLLRVDDALNWPPSDDPIYLPAVNPPTDPEELAQRVRLSYHDKNMPYVQLAAKAFEASDVDALIAALHEGVIAARARQITPFWVGLDLVNLPPRLGLALWNALPGEVTVYYPDYVMQRWGQAALPGLKAHFGICAESRSQYWVTVGASEYAAESARMGFRAKVPAQRMRGQQWLKAWPEHAAAGLLPLALGTAGAEQENASAALRFMVANGQLDTVNAVASRYQRPEVMAALQALLNQDPMDLYPAKVAKLPAFWQPQLWARPVLVSGHALPDAAVDVLGQMLGFDRPAGLYAGLEQAIQACTRESLATFAWDLFSAWLAAGAPSKDSWAFAALGLLGDEHAVHRLAPMMQAWPREGGSARATLGLIAMAELGTDSALRLVADLTGDKIPKGLRSKAQELLQQAADARGMGLPDLEDRLVPGLGLDARGQTTLDYGPRQFLLALDENLKPWLRKLEGGQPGARLKSLPAKNAADDPALAQLAGERFATIKKQAEGVAKTQLRRLEQAMCTGRRWSWADFDALYVQQPLLRQLATRLIWGVYEDRSDAPDAAQLRADSVRHRPERLVQVLRLGGDGELSTTADDPWHWPTTAVADGDEALGSTSDAPASGRWRMGLVHPLELGADARAAWAQLLSDYELMQPFEQLARQITPSQPADARDKQGQALLTLRVSPRRLLGLKSRAWSLSSHDGDSFDGAERELDDGLRLALQVSPGVHILGVDAAPPQSLTRLQVSRLSQPVPWAELSPLVFSEVLRDMAYLAV